MDGPDGPIRMSVNTTTGSAVIDMGVKGKMSYKMNAAKQSMQLDFSMVTLPGLADMMTQLFTQLGGTAGRQVVDMTDVKGNYEASIEISLADIIAMAKSAGMDVSAAAGPGRLAVPRQHPAGHDRRLNDRRADAGQRHRRAGHIDPE